MADCFSRLSPSAATSALASATEYDGKIHSASTFSDSSISESSSRTYSPCALKDTNGVDLPREQGFRTRSSQSGLYGWGEKWAFEIFTSERGTGYPDHASDSRRLLEESMNKLNPEGHSWSAQGDSQDLGSNWTYISSMFLDGGTGSLHGPSDGAAVVALLSSPNFAIQSLEDEELDDATEHDQNRYKTPQVEPETDTELRKLATVNPLNLLPKFNREASDVPEKDTYYSFTANNSATRTPKNPQSASEIVQPWIGMYNSYLVDVWDVLGFAKTVDYSETVIPCDNAQVLGQECSATSRLAMIRKHIDYLEKW